MLFCIVKAVFLWLILNFVGINLIGFIVRGILDDPPLVDPPTERFHEYLKAEQRSMIRASKSITLFSVIVAIGYVYVLYSYWNLLMAVSGVILMFTRLPDLLWEIRTGRRVNRKDCPKGVLYYAVLFVDFAVLPLVWYAVCAYQG